MKTFILVAKVISKYKIIFRILIISIIITHFIQLVNNSWSSFRYPYWSGYEALKNAYLHSQYIITNPKGSIPDETLYAYAAGAYLRGESLLDVNPGTPPLGKFIFSLSILLFNNPNMLLIICMILFLLGVYTLSLRIFSSIDIALLTTLLVFFQPLIGDQLKYMPLLDLPLLVCHIWSMYFFMYSIENNNVLFSITAFFILGMAMVIKIFSISLPLLLIYSLYILFKYKRFLLAMLVGYGCIILCFIVSYIPIYYREYSPADVMGIQIWSYMYNTSKLNNFFTVWDLIFFNRWHVWWGGNPVIHDPNWHISWPIVFSLSLYWLIMELKHFILIRIDLQVVYLWMIIYFIMLSINQATARYLIPILPYAYIISVYVLGCWVRWIANYLHLK